MQNLVIDFGNTLQKIAIFDGRELIYKNAYSKIVINDILHIQEHYPKIGKTIFSTVVPLQPELNTFLRNNCDAHELTHLSKIPVKNNYLSPETLGKDRLAAVVGAFQLFPNQNLLIIDAGSSITYDMIDKQAQYWGGSISPGIQMRFKALHQFTGKLPLLTFADSRTPLIGKNTNEAILSGVLNGIYAEVDGIIDHYKIRYPDIQILFTGGDLKHFDKNLKNNIFAEENLVLQGLNFILEYNDIKTA